MTKYRRSDLFEIRLMKNYFDYSFNWYLIERKIVKWYSIVIYSRFYQIEVAKMKKTKRRKKIYIYISYLSWG